MTQSVLAGEHVLVTGASGYIGSMVVKLLNEREIGATATARNPTATLIEELGHSVLKLDVMEGLPSFDGVTTAIHCATPNDIMSREADGGIPLAVSGTRALLEHCVEHGVKRFVYLSTVQVYGTELEGVLDEHTPVKPANDYGLNHYLGEEVCRYYAGNFDLDVILVRPANVYGAPLVSSVDRWTLVPMCFVKDAAETGKIELRSSGKQTRNFVSTHEVADCIISTLDNFPAGCTVLHAASDWSASMVEVATMVEDEWKALIGNEIELSILSDLPKAGNEFSFAPQSIYERVAPETSREQMIDTIRQLIRLKTKD